MVLLSGIWLVSLAVGAGVAYGLHMLKPVVSSVVAMNQLTPLPVLGVVSTAFPTRHRLARRSELLRFAAAALCLVLALGLVVGLNRAGIRLLAGPSAAGTTT
jgi:hypothetical protein